MKCNNCGSHELKAFNSRDFSSLAYLNDNKWILQDPCRKFNYLHTSNYYEVVCNNCGDYFSIKELDNLYSPKINHKEIVLDLDHTLIHSVLKKENLDIKGEEIISPKGTVLTVVKRPFLEEFLKNCYNEFDKVNIFSSCQRWYLEEVLKVLDIPKEKLGYANCIEDCKNERSLLFHREWMKYISNSFIIEDNPHVIKGFNNVIYKIKPFNCWSEEKDEELKNVLDNLGKKENIINKENVFDLELKLFLRKENIVLKGIDRNLVDKILKLEIIDEKTLETYPVRTTLFDSVFERGQKNYITIVDLDFNKYEYLCELISSYSDYKQLNEKDYNDLIFSQKSLVFDDF